MSKRKRKPNTASVSQPLTAEDAIALEVKSQIAQDAFANPAAKIGFGSESLAEGTEYPLTRLTQNYMLLLSLYRGSGIMKRIINKPVEDAISHWYKITSQITPEQMDMIARLERKTKLRRDIEQGMKWGRLYGGAAGLIMIEGQGDTLDEPLDLESIEPDSFKGIYIVDRWSGVYPSLDLVDDISSTSFGEPEFYQVRIREDATESMLVHHTRIIRDRKSVV